MNHFDYRNGVLHAEAVNLSELADARRHAVLLLFDRDAGAALPRLRRGLRRREALVCYAMKANSNQSVLRTLAKLGAGADVVSGGELKRALAAGIPAATRSCSPASARPKPSCAPRSPPTSSASTSNPSPSSSCCRGSPPRRAGKTARISVRVNPDVDAGTHAKISTGKSENKFGIPIARAREVYARAAKLPGIEVTGVDMHIGSQITDLEPMETAFRILSDFVQTLRADGHTISHVDFGGGLGIPYHMDREPPPAPDAYAAMVKRVTHNLGCTLMFEPGRMIVGNAGILVTRVIYVKRGEAKNFVIIDAAMNDLIRPTLYEAHHDILPVRSRAGRARHRRRRGRPGLRDRRLPRARPRAARAKPGDLLAIMTAGAYGAVQAGTYNTRPLVPEVLEFVALLIGVVAFAACMVTGGSILAGIEQRFGTSDDLLAFGPALRLGLSAATAVVVYRRAVGGRPGGAARTLAPPLNTP
jgi:diaminopimelate decarboxylase